MVVKEQEEPEKQEKLENLDPNKVLPDITLLINERDYLKDEVRTLREHLENENVRYTELKSLKHQQVGALTFKLAKAIRDKERALEEKEEIHKKFTLLQNKHEELLFQYSIQRDKAVAFGRDHHHYDGSIRKRALSVPKMSCFAVTGVFKSPSSPENDRDDENIEEHPIDYGEESSQQDQTTSVEETQEIEAKKDTTDEHKDDANAQLGSVSPSFTTDNESLLAEFRNIQQELSDVKKNMSIVQALNERLSSELEILEDIKKKPDFVRSISERSRKKACSSLSDFVDGKKEPPRKFVFPEVQQSESLGDSVEKTEIRNLERKEEDLASPPSESEKRELIGAKQDIRDREYASGEDSNTAASKNHAVSDVSTQHTEIDFKKQLEKAMKELEDIRADNRVMKHQIDRMAFSSPDHKDFLRRTTDFTGQILKEMKERGEQTSRKTSAESQPPLNILGTRLDEIMKAVDDMTFESQITPKTSHVVLTSRHLSTPPTPQETRQVESKEALSATKQKGRIIHGKLSEASLYDRRSLTSGLAGLRKISEPLPKEWRSTETLSYNNPLSTSFSNSLGYRDYIQRHIVMSSTAIAKIRDLTPEEIDHGEQQHFIY